MISDGFTSRSAPATSVVALPTLLPPLPCRRDLPARTPPARSAPAAARDLSRRGSRAAARNEKKKVAEIHVPQARPVALGSNGKIITQLGKAAKKEGRKHASEMESDTPKHVGHG